MNEKRPNVIKRKEMETTQWLWKGFQLSASDSRDINRRPSFSGDGEMQLLSSAIVVRTLKKRETRGAAVIPQKDFSFLFLDPIDCRGSSSSSSSFHCGCVKAFLVYTFFVVRTVTANRNFFLLLPWCLLAISLGRGRKKHYLLKKYVCFPKKNVKEFYVDFPHWKTSKFWQKITSVQDVNDS